jgi:hypothetical protein
MRRQRLALLALLPVLILGLAACGGNGKGNGNPAEQEDR